jgi:hypothetical protein
MNIDRFAHIRAAYLKWGVPAAPQSGSDKVPEQARDTGTPGQNVGVPRIGAENTNELADFLAVGHGDTQDTAKHSNGQILDEVPPGLSLSDALNTLDGEILKSEEMAGDHTVGQSPVHSIFGVPSVPSVLDEKPLKNEGILGRESGTPQKNAGVPGVPQAGSGETPESDEVAKTVIERIARLDRERNKADRIAGRGYDYDKSGTSRRFIPVNQPLSLVVEPDSQFGLCEVCGDPAAIVIPSPISGMSRFCGGQCLATTRTHQGKIN